MRKKTTADACEATAILRQLANAFGYSLVADAPSASGISVAMHATDTLSGSDENKIDRLTTATAWLRASCIRKTALGPAMAADPAWDMLLDLYVHRCRGAVVSITSACIASGVPASTSLRWIAMLEERGWVCRIADPVDRRRSYLQLSAEAIHDIELALDNVVGSDRKLGLERMTSR